MSSRSSRRSGSDASEAVMSATQEQQKDAVESDSEPPSGKSNITSEAEFELQSWNLMWSHLFGMITQVVDYPNVFPESGDQKRAVLVELVVKLCESASEPKEGEDYAKLKKKYKKCKESLKCLKAQSDELLQEVEQSRRSIDEQTKTQQARDQEALFSEIKQLEGLVKQQIERQEELFKSRRGATEMEMQSSGSSCTPPVRHRSRRRNEDYSDAPVLEKPRKSMREAADEAAAKVRSPPRRNTVTKQKTSPAVDKLVELTNQLRDDYRRLGEYGFFDGSISELSIEHLSRLNESLIAGDEFSSSSG